MPTVVQFCISPPWNKVNKSLVDLSAQSRLFLHLAPIKILMAYDYPSLFQFGYYLVNITRLICVMRSPILYPSRHGLPLFDCIIQLIGFRYFLPSPLLPFRLFFTNFLILFQRIASNFTCQSKYYMYILIHFIIILPYEYNLV